MLVEDGMVYLASAEGKGVTRIVTARWLLDIVAGQNI